jgi:cytochrome c
MSLLLFLLIASCAQVNTESRDHFYKGTPFRHGIIPIQIDMETGSGPYLSIDENSAKRGKRVYERNCLACHGDKGRGDGPVAHTQELRPADLAMLARKVPNFKFFMMNSQLKGDMPGWRNMFSERDINDLENYLRKLSRK